MLTITVAQLDYTVGDIMARVVEGLTTLQQASRQWPGLHWVVGAPLAREGIGKKLQNALVVIQAGEIVLRYAKQLLPIYNAFDERRHVEPGPDVARVLRIGDNQVGPMICEDGWNDGANDATDDGREDYTVNPFMRLADAAPDLVVSINASPSEIGKREQRHQVFGDASTRHALPLLFVNQIGGQEQIVFDGASFAVEPGRGVAFEAQRFNEDVTTLRFDPVIDEILKILIEGRRLARWEHDAALAFVEPLRTTPEGEALVQRTRGMIARNEYRRRQAPPIIRVRSRAFGVGRQMPIATKFV